MDGAFGITSRAKPDLTIPKQQRPEDDDIWTYETMSSTEEAKEGEEIVYTYTVKTEPPEISPELASAMSTKAVESYQKRKASSTAGSTASKKVRRDEPTEKIPPPDETARCIHPTVTEAPYAGLGDISINKDPLSKASLYFCGECTKPVHQKQGCAVHIRRVHQNTCLACPTPGCHHKYWKLSLIHI